MVRSWLKNKRRLSNIEVAVIMESVNISRQYYNMLEAGTRNPSVTVAQKMGELMNFDWTLFFSEEAEATVITEANNPLVHGHK